MQKLRADRHGWGRVLVFILLVVVVISVVAGAVIGFSLSDQPSVVIVPAATHPTYVNESGGYGIFSFGTPFTVPSCLAFCQFNLVGKLTFAPILPFQSIAFSVRLVTSTAVVNAFVGASCTPSSLPTFPAQMDLSSCEINGLAQGGIYTFSISSSNVFSFQVNSNVAVADQWSV